MGRVRGGGAPRKGSRIRSILKMITEFAKPVMTGYEMQNRHKEICEIIPRRPTHAPANTLNPNVTCVFDADISVAIVRGKRSRRNAKMKTFSNDYNQTDTIKAVTDQLETLGTKVREYLWNATSENLPKHRPGY